MDNKNMIEFISQLATEKIYLSVDGEDLKVDFEQDEISEATIEEIRKYKSELINYLNKYQPQSSYAEIVPLAKANHYVLSSAQLRLWILSQFEEGNIAYNMPASKSIHGAFDLSHFVQSINAVIDRHEILRTVFRKNETGEVHQWILDRETIGFHIPYIDYSDQEDGLKAAKAYIAEDAFQPFDLAEGPLLRASLLKIGDYDHIFYYNMHHIISDGWSLDIMERDVLAHYEALMKQTPVQLPALAIQYKDYAAWQQAQLSAPEYQVHQAYWLEQLSGELPLLDLPTFKARPLLKTSNGQTLGTWLSPELSQQLKAYCRANRGSLFIGLTASLSALLYRYTACEDVILGTPIIGRDHPDLEDQIGFYLNTLVLRNSIQPEENFDQLFEKVREKTLSSYAHQVYPFDTLVDQLNLKRDTSRSAVFDLMITLHNNRENKGREEGPIYDEVKNLGPEVSKFDLEFDFEEIGEAISLRVIFNTDVYDEITIQRFIIHYKKLLSLVLENSQQPIGDVNYLSQQTLDQLGEFNEVEPYFSLEKNVVERIREKVQLNPEKTALKYQQQTLSYGELENQSNQLARYLDHEFQSGRDQLFGIMMDRSITMAICILAVWKSGAAYVPIDRTYPNERIRQIIESSQLKALIVDASVAPQQLDQLELTPTVISIESIEPSLGQYSTEPLSKVIGMNDLAYVIFTSGSTGKPKGVMIEHLGMINHMASKITELGMHGESLMVQNATHTFDISVWQYFSALITGGTTLIYDRPTVLEPVDFITQMEEDQATVLELVPSYLVEMLLVLEEVIDHQQFFSRLEILVLNAETLMPSMVKRWLQLYPHIPIVNTFGITETSDDISHYVIREYTEMASVPVMQKPIQHIHVHILDDQLQLVPIGVKGEIFVSGLGVGRGYFNDAERTLKAFLKGPIEGVTNHQRIYRTGDLGRYLPNGIMEFLGRKDTQVKIRGNRIELGEIEHALMEMEAIVNVKALANQEAQYIVAYYQSESEIDQEVLLLGIKEKLPEYMLPAYFVYMQKFPLTPNGKIDRKQLPLPDNRAAVDQAAYVAPRNELESKMVEIWKEVLKRDRISIKDNFYELGGDSIKSIQVVSRLRKYGYMIRIEQVLLHPVLESLTKQVTAISRTIDQSAVVGTFPLSPIQRSFLNDPYLPIKHHYNQSILLFSKHRLEETQMITALRQLTIHHDALRMVFKKEGAQWVQENRGTQTDCFEVRLFDFSDQEDFRPKLNATYEELQSSIDLEQGPLLKAGIYRCSDGDRLLLVAHHLVVDGVSWRILLEDLTLLYDQQKEQAPLELPLKTDAFKTWSKALQQYRESEQLAKEKAYWTAILKTHIPDFPSDFPVNAARNEKVGSTSFTLDKATTNLLQTQCNRVYQTQITDLLLSVLGMSLKAVFGIDKYWVKMEGHGREEIIDQLDITRTVGWFTSEYPFVLDVTAAATATEALVQVKEDLRRLPNKGIGYGILHGGDNELGEKINAGLAFNFLGDFGHQTAEPSATPMTFEYLGEYKGLESAAANSTLESAFDILGMIINGQLTLSMSYPSAAYQETTIQKLKEAFQSKLTHLINTLAQEKETYLSPSDLTYQGLSIAELNSINPNNDLEDIYKLSPLQEGIYYHWLAESDHSIYFEQLSYHLEGAALDLQAIRKAFDLLIDRHAVLRTSFTHQLAFENLQIVRKQVESDFVYERIPENIGEADWPSYVQRYKEEDRAQGFNLEEGSQIRLIILEGKNHHYEFIWSFHHILIDGWCMSLLINDFNSLLQSVLTQTTAELPTPQPYATYIRWLDQIDRENSLSYWKDYLAEYTALATLPFTPPQTEQTAYDQQREQLIINQQCLQSIRTLCQACGITENTFLQSVWGFLLSKYNQTHDVVFGAVVSGRPGEIPEVEQIIGLFINTIPVRVRYRPNESARDLLKRTQAQAIESLQHHYLNLAEVQSQSSLGIHLMDHVLVYENYVVAEPQTDSSAAIKEEANMVSRELFEKVNYDFSIQIVPGADQMHLDFIFNTQRFAPEEIRRLTTHLQTLIEAFVAQPDQALEHFEFLPQPERQLLSQTFSTRPHPYPQKTVLEFFEEQVRLQADRVAVIHEDQQLSYQLLDQRSNQLAHYLSHQDIPAESFISICLDRSVEMVIGVLAILKAGAAYVPIDPVYPEQRIRYIVEDAQLSYIITSEQHAERFRPIEGLSVISIDGQQSLVEQKSTQQLDIQPKLDQLVYMIYTSGSTGKPKGVMVEHRGLSNLVQFQIGLLELTPSNKTLQFASLGFDASASEIFDSLVSGGCLIIPKKEELLSIDQIMALIRKHQIDIVTLPPSYQALIKDELSCIRKMISAGEAMNPAVVRELQVKGVKVINGYGPTENTIGVAMSDDPVLEDDRVTIGKPIRNVEVYLLSEFNELVPLGAIGEICVGGVQVARGYWNRPGQNTQKFIPHPFSTTANARLYKTGDLARWLPDGRLEFIGRKDNQVKIQGHRVELGEIEQALLALDDLQEAAVITRLNTANEMELVAYFTASQKQASNTLRSLLQNKLPYYMIPLYFIQLEEMPLTTNGKVDRNQLPPPESLGLQNGQAYLAPRTTTEEQLAAIWEEVLERPKIGVQDTFFELGGNSLKLIRLNKLVNRAFQTTIKIPVMFRLLNIELMAAHLDGQQSHSELAEEVIDESVDAFMEGLDFFNN